MAIHDFDRAMENVSIGLTQNLMVGRIIGNIRVSMTEKRYAKIKNEMHRSVTPKLLAKKWVIGLEKAKETVKATTQDFISSSLLPLTRMYRTYLISQRLRRISCMFIRIRYFRSEIYHRKHMCSNIHGWRRLCLLSTHAL